MKVSLPSRIPLIWVAAFLSVLTAVELLEGTAASVAFASSAFLLVSAVAFNLAGGLQYPSGAYVFFCSIFTCGIGILGKAVLGEPLQANLSAPLQTMCVYLLGMCSMLAAVAINVVVRRKGGLLPDTLEGVRVDQVAIGCILLAILPPYILPGNVVATFVQFNYFGLLAIMLPVYQRVKDTDGNRSFDWVALFVWIYLTIQFGFLSFSKQGIFQPSFAWAAAAVAGGYRVSLRKLVVLTAIAVPALPILTSFSQVGREYRTIANPTQAAIDLLMHPVETRRIYQESQMESLLLGFGYHWYNEPQGLLDRLAMVPVDDALIYTTDHGNPGSLDAVWSYFTNLIPRYLYPDKPTLRWGNIYGGKIGLVSDEDETTGISFSPFADAYQTGKWFGVTVISCPIFLLFFYISDSLVGRVVDSRWSLLYVLWLSHNAAEGLLSTPIYGAGTFSLVVIAAHLVSTRFAPLLGSMVTLPQRELMKQEGSRIVTSAGTVQSTRV